MALAADWSAQSVDVPGFVEVGGTTVRVLTRQHSAAHRRPLLLINGIGARLEMWQPFCLAAPDWPVLMFDLPGISGNASSSLKPDMPGLAQWLTHLMDAMHVDQADVLGYSWGGTLAQQLARDAPERVHRLVLASTHFGFGAVPVPQLLAMLEFSPNIGSDNPWELLNAMLGGAPDDRNPIGAMINVLNPETSSMRGAQSQLLAFTGWSSQAWLHEINLPTLVIAGEGDSLIPLAVTRFIAQSIADARLEIIPSGGHLVPINRPVQMAEAVAEFLGRS
jgi:pimeloyl-ACP methyl ester carboxylesterase